MRPVALYLAATLLGAGTPAPEKATAFERAVVQEMSDARVAPKAYAEHLKALRSQFEGTLWRVPGRVPLRTEEGVAALDEAIRFLETTRPAGPLRFNEGLARAAREHARYLGPRGLLSHQGADGSGPAARLDRLGRWQSLVAENISTGEDDPRMVVVQLLVDDGVPSRGHRRNLFNADLHQAGAGEAPHAAYGTVCVIDYADGFVADR
ncbi:MAG TPA: CAP domain-containing protein [Holophagaceae bacterium]